MTQAEPHDAATGATPLATAAANPATVAPDRIALIRLPISVRWRDLDAFQHVNNSTFLTYIEEARMQWFQSLSGPWMTEDASPVLAASQVNYRRPIAWPEALVVELFAGRVGTTSLTLEHRITSTRDTGALYCDGHSVLVWVDRRGGKPVPLPDAVLRAHHS